MTHLEGVVQWLSGAAAGDMAKWAGLLICCAWYYTILAGFYILYCPILYMMFFNHQIYRTLTDTLFALWELYPVGLFQCCANTKVHHYGDMVNPDENTIIIMNHRTRVDWNYVWMGMYHATQKTNEEKEISVTDKDETSGSKLKLGGKAKTKFVLKDELKMIPGLGWIMQLNYFLYVKRDWREDELNMNQFIDYYDRIGSGYRIIIFPEGTDLTQGNIQKSYRFAINNRLPQLQYVLHPRTTGFAVLCSRMRRTGLASVYDVTVAYDKPAQTEGDLLKGNLPSNVHFHIKRYSIDELPHEEDNLRTWLSTRWQEKENSLRTFHNSGNYLEHSTDKHAERRKPRPLALAKCGLVFWTIVDFIFIFALFNSFLFQFWVIYNSILFAFVTWKFGGFHNIQYKIIDRKVVDICM